MNNEKCKDMLALPYYEEVWKDIPQGRGVYQINNVGYIKSLERVVAFGNQQRVVKEKIIIPRIRKTQSGYKQRIIEIFGKTYTVARLVAQAFIPNPDNLPEVDHINTDPTDNRVENLKWVPHIGQYDNPLTKQHLSEMQMGGKNHQYGKTGVLNKQSKPVLQFDLNNNFIQEWECTRQIERELGIDHICISRCCNGKYKTAGGYIWKWKFN